MQPVMNREHLKIKTCGVCGSIIISDSPVDDLCKSCFEKEVMLSKLIEYLQNSDAKKLNIIQSHSVDSGSDKEKTEGDMLLKLFKKKTFLVRSSNGEKFELVLPVTVFGRNPEKADRVIPNSVMSGKHASVISENDMYYLEDNNSSNGTWLNGKKLEPNTRHLLRDMDVIRFANEELIFMVK